MTSQQEAIKQGLRARHWDLLLLAETLLREQRDEGSRARAATLVELAREIRLARDWQAEAEAARPEKKNGATGKKPRGGYKGFDPRATEDIS